MIDDILKEFMYVIEIQNIYWGLDEHSIDDTVEALIPYFLEKNHQTNYYILKSLDKAIKYRPSKFKYLLELFERLTPYIKKSGISYEQLYYEIFISSIDIKRKLKSIFGKSDNLCSKQEDGALYYSIMYDEIDEFISIVSHTNLDLNNSRINLNKKTKIDMISNNTSLIELAAYFGAIKIFKYLWLNNAEINESSLGHAIAGGNSEIIHLIENKFENLNIKNGIYIAAKYNQKDILDYLLNNYGISFTEEKIWEIIWFDNIELFLEFQENEHINNSSEQRQAVVSAVQNSNLLIFKYCVRKYWNYFCLDDLYFILKKVIKSRSLEMTKFLFDTIEEHYCVITKSNFLNESSKPSFDFKHIGTSLDTSDLLKYFVEKKIISINEELLVDYSANSPIEVIKYIYTNFHFKKFKNGFTPFHSACDNGNYKAVIFFAEKEKEWVTLEDEDGYLPIHYAATNDKTKVMSYLVNELKCDVNARDNNGKTPLHLAAEKNQIENVNVLLSRKDIDLNAKANIGGTALEMAAVHGNREIEKILRTHGGKYSIFSNDCFFFGLQIIYCFFFSILG